MKRMFLVVFVLILLGWLGSMAVASDVWIGTETTWRAKTVWAEKTVTIRVPERVWVKEERPVTYIRAYPVPIFVFPRLCPEPIYVTPPIIYAPPLPW